MKGYDPIYIFLIFLISALWVSDHAKLERKINDHRCKVVQVFRDTILNKKTLYEEIKRLKIKSPEIVFRQAMLETGNLSCLDCSLDRNNLFGFYDTKYLSFEDWRQCVAYYYSWQKRRYKGGDYYEFLRAKWGCENPEAYVQELKRF